MSLIQKTYYYHRLCQFRLLVYLLHSCSGSGNLFPIGMKMRQFLSHPCSGQVLCAFVLWSHLCPWQLQDWAYLDLKEESKGWPNSHTGSWAGQELEPRFSDTRGRSSSCGCRNGNGVPQHEHPGRSFDWVDKGAEKEETALSVETLPTTERPWDRHFIRLLKKPEVC